MFLRCSVRIHGCTGSPADYPNMMLSWRVLGKLSCFYSLRELSSSVHLWPRWLSCPLFLWVGTSSSLSLAGQPARHSCSISWVSCQMVWGMFKGTASEEGKQGRTPNNTARLCSGKIFWGTVWQRTWEVVSTYRPPPASQRTVTLYRLSSPEQGGWEVHISYFHSHLLMFLAPSRLTSHFGQGKGIYHSTIENTGWRHPTWQIPSGTNGVINH